MGDFIHIIKSPELAKTNAITAIASSYLHHVIFLERNRNFCQNVTETINPGAKSFIQVFVVLFGPLVSKIDFKQNIALFPYLRKSGDITLFSIGDSFI